MQMIGLTGGIGSGKTTVAGIFRSMRIPVYDSDSRAKWLMESDPHVIEGITGLFGEGSYDKDGRFQRSWIAERVFGNETMLDKLNAIVHPAVGKDVRVWITHPDRSTAPYVLKESAILFEENLVSDLNAMILVVAPEEVRIRRVVARDQVTEEKVRARILHQWSDEKKIPLSDYVIFNDGERSLIEQVLDIHQVILTRIEQRPI
jgi:dephospho-CoA kinase